MSIAMGSVSDLVFDLTQADGVTFAVGDRVLLVGQGQHPPRPRRRRSRSGRWIYGTAEIWTDRPDDKLERRRIRSRVASRHRGRAPEPSPNGVYEVLTVGTGAPWRIRR